MTSLGTYWRTLRHLRVRQITGRIAFRLRRPQPDFAPPPSRRSPSDLWVEPAHREASLHGATTFEFLSETHDLEAIGWDHPDVSKLWRYNQHYFDDLNALDARERQRAHGSLIARWIAQNPPAAGSGWEPYPTSLRIVNWIKWSLSGGHLTEAAQASMAVQIRWLTQRLETHLMGNHLFANAKALVFAGLYFEGPKAERWMNLGMSILERELIEQVLPDGGHFERSPMYHALALEDVLDLVNVMRTFGAERSPLSEALIARVAAMQRWLSAMTHPDGTLAHFNDTAQGIAPSNDELARYASRLCMPAQMPVAEPILHLVDSGYLRVTQHEAVALLDLAAVGPDYLPGHAHADTLSFELTLGSRRIVVNGGTSCYGISAQRQRERSTSAHSTVEVEGQSSSEVWAGFRVGRRARPSSPSVTLTSDTCEIRCSHDGYRHLRGSPAHERTWRFHDGTLAITDNVSNPRLHAISRFHLAPGIALHPTSSSNRWQLVDADVVLCHVEVLGGQARDEPSFHAQRFGAVQPARCLAVTLESGESAVRWNWIHDRCISSS